MQLKIAQICKKCANVCRNIHCPLKWHHPVKICLKVATIANLAKMGPYFLGRGETHVSVHWTFVNLMNALCDFLRGKAHQYHSEEAKRNASACHVPWKNWFWHVRVRTVNLLIPSVRRSHSSYFFQPLENMRFQWVYIQ